MHQQQPSGGGARFIKAMRKVGMAIVFIFVFQCCAAQVIDAAISDRTDRFPIMEYVSILKTSELISLDSAIALDRQGAFKRAPDKPVLVLNYDPYFYWFRFIIKNSAAHERKLMLLMAPIGMREGQLFQKKDTGWQSLGKTGIRYPFKERPYQFTHNVFPFTVPAQTIDTLYLQTDASNVYKSFGFALIKPKELKVFENKVYFIFGIIVGLLALFCILNVSLFFVLKIRVHLWYALYILFLFLIVMKNDHLDQQFLDWDSELAYRLSPYMAIGAIALAILMHVVQLFFKDVIRRGSFLYVVSALVKINVLLSGLAHYTFFMLSFDHRFLSLAFHWAKYSTLLAIVVIIVDGIYSIAKGFKSAFFILAGQLVFLVGAAQRLFFPSTLSFLFPPTTFHIGIILETLIITLGLVYQYYWIEKEQDRQREIAFREELHQAELEIKEQTLQNMSLEIHDNILQILGLAKLNINMIDDKEPKTVREFSERATEMVSRAIFDLRNMAKTLDTEFVSHADLISLIKMELGWIKETGRYDTKLELEGNPYQLPQNLIIFRAFQEILNNILKHANATTILVKATFTPYCFQLLISDDGRGFNFASVMTAPKAGIGISNIRSRVNRIGGSCLIESVPEKGTTVTISIPVLANI